MIKTPGLGTVAPVVAYGLSAMAANWAVVQFGMIPVGFGLVAPAAVYFAGLTLVLRDWVQESVGAKGALIAIFVGAQAMAWLAPIELVFASTIAFLASELMDMAVYTPLRNRGQWMLGVALSNTVGLAIDSVLFLWVAFGSLSLLAGQMVGKAWVTLAAIAAMALLRIRWGMRK